jgi:hypothetical protein
VIIDHRLAQDGEQEACEFGMEIALTGKDKASQLGKQFFGLC